MKICPNCNTVIISQKNNKIYCSRLCQQRYATAQYYLKNRDDPEFQKKRRKVFLRWVRVNKDKYSHLQKVYRLRKAQREMGEDKFVTRE